jgi:hypothetical protein
MRRPSTRTSLLAVASTALVAGSITTAAPASADTPGCVSGAEYKRVEVGMTMKRAHAIFDTDGSRLGLDGNDQVRLYPTCGDDQATVGLNLRREDGVWRVAQKYRNPA